MVQYEDGVPEDLRALLFDPQTAGGLLISTPDGALLARALGEAGVGAVEIGEVMTYMKSRIQVS
jgi:selenide,water dikinase